MSEVPTVHFRPSKAFRLLESFRPLEGGAMCVDLDSFQSASGHLFHESVGVTMGWFWEILAVEVSVRDCEIITQYVCTTIDRSPG